MSGWGSSKEAVSAISKHDIDVSNVPQSSAEPLRCKQREKWRVARQVEKVAIAKRGVRLLCKTPSCVTPIPPLSGVTPIPSTVMGAIIWPG